MIYLQSPLLGAILRRFRKGVNKIRSSPQRIEHYRECCNAVNKSKILEDETQHQSRPKQLVMDVKTRWNSTFAMVDRGLEMRRAYNMTCGSIPELGVYALNEKEWRVLEELQKILMPFSALTNLLSGANYPSLSSTIVGYNVLIDHLEDYRDKSGRVRGVIFISMKLTFIINEGFSCTVRSN